MRNQERFAQIIKLRLAIKQQENTIYRLQSTEISTAQELKIEKARKNLIVLKRRLSKRQRWGLDKIRTMGNADADKAERVTFYKIILYQRYYRDASWQEIADLTGYSIRHCKRLNRLALESI